MGAIYFFGPTAYLFKAAYSKADGHFIKFKVPKNILKRLPDSEVAPKSGLNHKHLKEFRIELNSYGWDVSYDYATNKRFFKIKSGRKLVLLTGGDRVLFIREFARIFFRTEFGVPVIN